MQSILREKLMALAMELSVVSGIYRSESHRFVDAYISWLEAAEKNLSSLRSPLCILLQAEKTSLTSVPDGYRPNYLDGEKSLRKSQKAVAAQSLERVAKEIYAKIENIDQTFEQINEKLCHAVAVLLSKDPELTKNLPADQAGVQRIWSLLGSTAETIPMYHYFCAKLSFADIQYLLMDILQKIAGNKPA